MVVLRSRTCAAAVALALLLGADIAGQAKLFHAETRLVVLHVLVTNGRGEVVTDLDRGAFAIYENGHRQSIAVFRRGDVPISLGLIIDNSGSMRTIRPRVEAAALAFVRASNPQDEVFVESFADTPHLDVPFTSDTRALEYGIARVDAIGGTAMRDAILMAEQYLHEHASRDRRGLLVITDGNDNASIVSKAQLRKVAERSEAIIDAVKLAAGAGTPDDERDDGDLDRLTSATGGAVHHVRSLSDVDNAVLEIAHQMRNEYTIAYTPANAALDGSYRSVRVKITRPGGLNARTRPGYWASSP